MNSTPLVLAIMALVAVAQEPAQKKPNPKETQAVCGRLVAIGERGITRYQYMEPSLRIPERELRDALVGFDDLAGLEKLLSAEVERALNRKIVLENRRRLSSDRSAAAQEEWKKKIAEADLNHRVRLGVSEVVADIARRRTADAIKTAEERRKAEARAEVAKREAAAAEEEARKRAEEHRKAEEEWKRFEEQKKRADANLRASLRVGATATEIDATGSLPSSTTTTTDSTGVIEVRTYKHLRLSLTFRNDVLVSWTETSR